MAPSATNDERRKLYEYAVDDAGAFAFIILDRSGKVTYWNTGATRIFGFPEAEAIGMDACNFFTPEDNALDVPKKELKRALADGHADDERWQLHKDGHRFWASGITSVVRNDAGEVIGFSKVLRENTVRKLTEDDIKAANSRLMQFAYVASHDLNEPLRMVTTFLELLSRRIEGKLDSDSMEFLEYARDGAKRMRTLIDAILEFSKIGVSSKSLRHTDCNALVDSSISFMKILIDQNNALVTRSALPLLTVFPTLLEQVFQNLISNAIKYRNRSEPPKVLIDATEEEDHWVFSVRDNGIGIPEEDRERIFGEFERVQTSEDYPGTGLGLAICRRIIDRHGGKIWVESKVGEGSTFYFTIPKRLQIPLNVSPDRTRPGHKLDEASPAPPP